MMWECELGTQKRCLRLTASRSTGLAHWEHVHSTLYGLQPSCPLPSGTSCVTLHRDNASPKSVQEEHKEKVNLLPDIPSEPTCPLLPLALWSLSLLRRPFVKRIRSRLPEEQTKSWSGSSSSTLPGTIFSAARELIVPRTYHTFSRLHVFPLYMLLSWLGCPFLPAP